MKENYDFGFLKLRIEKGIFKDPIIVQIAETSSFLPIFGEIFTVREINE